MLEHIPSLFSFGIGFSGKTIGVVMCHIRYVLFVSHISDLSGSMNQVMV